MTLFTRQFFIEVDFVKSSNVFWF